MPQRCSNVLISTAALVAAVTFAGLLIGLIQGVSQPHSPADTIRPWAVGSWEEATEDRSSLPRLPPFPAADYFDAFRIAEEAEFIQVVIPNAVAWQYRPDYKHHDTRIRSGATPSPPTTLHAVGTIVPFVPPLEDPESTESRDFDSLYTKVVFVDPSGDPLDGVKWTQWFSHQFSPGYHPRVYLRFDHPAHPHLEIDRIRLFDRLTQVDLSDSGMKAQPMAYDGFTVAYADHLSWRRNQTLAALDVSVGPEHVISLDPSEGAEQSGGGQVLRLLRIFPGFVFSGASTMQVFDGEHTGLYRRKRKDPGLTDDAHTGFLIAAYPYGSWSSLSVDVLDREGNPIKSRVTTTYRMPYLVTCEAPLSEVGSIRAKVPDRFARLLIPLPDLPQLPAENDHLEDLFDMRIPLLRKGHEEEVISQLTQLEPHHHADRLSGTLPMAGNTTQGTGTTPREILEQLRLDYEPGTPIRTDTTKATLTIGKPPRATWWSRTKDWFRELWP